jgi:two-component system nitrogen regulation response regulator NtrX
MAANTFREDLFHRLAVVPVHVPALRQRVEDIPPLVEHFLGALANETGRRSPSFTPGALEALRRYPFPGNVRELKNLVERLVIMNPGARIGPEQVASVLPVAVPGAEAGAPAEAPAELSAAVHEFERRHIEAALAAEGGNMTRAAARLGLERSHLYKKMRQLGLRVDT